MANEEAEDTIMVSALEHYSYCPRQYALIHREQVFDENLYTLRGRFEHERVDEGTASFAEGVRTERAVPLWSERLGLVGKADVVEFHSGIPYPVEYKHGRVSAGRHADLQICAQGLCLEEMLGVPVPLGAVYQVSSRRRREVAFTMALRERVEETIASIRELQRQAGLPAPPADGRCDKCSLNGSCLPAPVAAKRKTRSMYQRLFSPEVRP